MAFGAGYRGEDIEVEKSNGFLEVPGCVSEIAEVLRKVWNAGEFKVDERGPYIKD